MTFCILPYFLGQDDLDSPCIFPAPVLESGIFPKSPGLFYWGMILETKIWILDMLVATEISFVLVFLS